MCVLVLNLLRGCAAYLHCRSTTVALQIATATLLNAIIASLHTVGNQFTQRVPGGLSDDNEGGESDSV